MKTGKGIFPWAAVLAAALALSACSPMAGSPRPEGEPSPSSAPASEAPSSLPAQEPAEEYTYLLGVRAGPSGSAGIRLSDHANREPYRQILPLLDSLSPGEEGDLGEYPLTLWVYSSHSYPLAYQFPAQWEGEGEGVPVFCQPAEGLEEACWYTADQEFLALLDSLLPPLPPGAGAPAPADGQDALWIRQADDQRSVELALTDPETLARIQSCLEDASPLNPPPDPLPEGALITITLRQKGRSMIYGLQDLGEKGCLVQNYQSSNLEESCAMADRWIYNHLASLLAQRPG